MDLLKWGRWGGDQRGEDNTPSSYTKCWKSRFEIISARQTDHGVRPEVKCGSAALCSVWLTPSGRGARSKTDSQFSTCSPLLSQGLKKKKRPSKQTFPPKQPVNLGWLCILWLCQHLGASEVYKNKRSAAETLCLLQMFGCPLIKYITGPRRMIETLPTMAPAICLSPRCGRAFSSQPLINKGITGWLKAAFCPPPEHPSCPWQPTSLC